MEHGWQYYLRYSSGPDDYDCVKVLFAGAIVSPAHETPLFLQ